MYVCVCEVLDFSWQNTDLWWEKLKLFQIICRGPQSLCQTIFQFGELFYSLIPVNTFSVQLEKMKWILVSQNALLKSYELSGLLTVHQHKTNQSFYWKISKRASSNSVLLRGPIAFSRSIDFMTAAWMQLCLFQSKARRQNATWDF